MVTAPAHDAAAIAEAWFCDRGDYWGTPKQLCLCAKCGVHKANRHVEMRYFRGLFTPHIHTICDECFEALPDDSAHISQAKGE